VDPPVRIDALEQLQDVGATSALAEHLLTSHLMQRGIWGRPTSDGTMGRQLIALSPDLKTLNLPWQSQARTPRSRKDARMRLHLEKRLMARGDAQRLVIDNRSQCDFLLTMVLCVGRSRQQSTSPTEMNQLEFYAFPNSFIREHNGETLTLQAMDKFKNDAGFDSIAKDLRDAEARQDA
jgi:hypothetical protein